MNWTRFLLAAVIGCLLILTSSAAWGQATASASLGGTVADKTGAVIPGANVSITNKAVGFTNPTSTTMPRAFIAEFGARLTF